MKWMDKFKAQLQQLRAPTVAELRSALQECACTLEEIAPYVSKGENYRAYGRNVLYRCADVEAIVMHLPPGAATSVHDHGESVGCAAILEGSMNNAIYRKTDYGMAIEVGSVIVRAGQNAFAPYGQIHQMRNDNSQRMVSLHLYAPPLSGMRCYVPEEDALLDYVI